jgi:hypothetical protein
MNKQQVLELIVGSHRIDMDKAFEISRSLSIWLSNEDMVDDAREVLIRILDNFKKFPEQTKIIWAELIENAGLYPYIDSSAIRKSSGLCLRYESYKSLYLKDLYLHEDQMKISNLLLNKESVIVSAPTSFGKSLLIEEVVASGIYDNIVIIQPTLALLDETRKKLKKYKGVYKIIVSTSQKPSKTKNVFLFTGERVLDYQYFQSIDFFVLDEFYKLSLSRDDDRAIILNLALYKLLKMCKKFYMLGPSVDKVSDSFLKKYDCNYTKSTFATVAVNIYDLNDKRSKEKENELYSLLKTLKDPTLVYCSSPNRTSTLAYGFCDSSEKKSKYVSLNKPMIEWIEENIHPEWKLIETLSNGIAYHHGGLPRHLSSSIVDSFNNNNIQFLFCTSTLIEGVNTATKNVILFDKKKGPKMVDFFDYKNIVGRSGRMGKHYVGNVYRFNPEPEQLEIDVDIPILDQENAPSELLLQMERGDLTPIGNEKLKEYNALNSKLKAVLKKNSGISIDMQIALLSHLESNFSLLYPLINWTTIPKYSELAAVLDLMWTFLLKPRESTGGVFSSNQLAVSTLQFYKFKSLTPIIINQNKSDFWIKKIPDEKKRLEENVRAVLNTARHWFDYRLPKLLLAVSELQTYVCENFGKAPPIFLRQCQ